MAGIDQFTQRARRVLSFAHKEAALNHTLQIGTEHLLLGLIQVQGSTAGKVLENLDVTADRVREINASLEREEAPIEINGIQQTLSPEVQEVLRRAIQRAVESKDNYISTEHLLLSLIEMPDTRAGRILERMGLNEDKIRNQLRNMMENGTNVTTQQEQQAPPPAEFSEVGANRRQQGLKKNESPLMDQLATDLTAKAAAGKLDPVVGRKNEIERVIQILARRTKNNPALIGEPGVGKTAIVEGLAQAVVDGNVPAQLLNKRVLQLDVGSLVAGTMYRDNSRNGSNGLSTN